ncbi:MAG: ribosome small subunit-dependent GTPase A [Actinobacteria bacterium]|nr:ribosome small subunit-dependent GTPase A [Actinomycetota bacterium]
MDEDDVRVRPTRGGSRPRSKDRPSHDQAARGTVIAVDRGRFTVALAPTGPGSEGRTVYAVKARELGRKGIVVGDDVDLVGDLSGDIDNQARLVRRHERTSNLRRTADDTDPVERVIVANATQLAIVTATTNPSPSFGLIDRALVAAYDSGVRPILIVTKTDLVPPDELRRMYSPLDFQMFEVSDRTPPTALQDALRDEVTVVIGHSGVGKSTLVNNLVPGTGRSTGIVNVVTGKGRHTSTNARAIALPGGGWIVDTPGIRSFGLAHVDLDRVIAAFPDLAAGTADCPRACSHDEPDCALNEWAEHQELGVRERLASMRRLLTGRTASYETGD